VKGKLFQKKPRESCCSIANPKIDPLWHAFVVFIYLFIFVYNYFNKHRKEVWNV
jgi:hypothetical protein